MPSRRHDNHLTPPQRLEGRRLLAGLLNTVDVDFEVGPIVADPTRNLAYVVDQTDGLLLAVDTRRGKTINVAALAGHATSVTIAPKGGRLYVAQPGAFQVEVFALPDLRRIGSLLLAGDPATIIAGVGARLYAGSAGQIRQYDATTGALLTSLPTNNWSGLYLSTAAGGTRLYARAGEVSAAGGFCEEFDIADPKAPRLMKLHPVSLANSGNFVVDATARRIYTADGGVYGVGVTNMDTGDQAVWRSAMGPYGVAVATREGVDRVWGWSYNGITEYRKATGAVKDTYPADERIFNALPWSIAVTANGDVLFASRNGYPGLDSKVRHRLNAIGFSPNAIVPRPLPAAPNAAYTTTISAGGRVQFDAAPSTIYGPWTIKSYAWDFGDGSVGSGREIEHAFAKSGSYNVKLIVMAGYGAEQDTLVKTVDVPAFVTSLSIPSAGHYRIGSQLEFQVTFSEPVRAAAGATIPIRIRNQTRQATFLPSRSTPTTLTFAYTVATGDWAASGIVLPAAIALPPQGSITDAGGKAVSLRLPDVDASRVIVGIAAPQLDVDGNGVPDLVWKNADGSAMAMLDGDPARPRQLGGGDGWQLAGMGDFNGDGITDPIWHHSAADRYVLRLSAANGALLAALDVGGDGWAVESTVDRTGDGKADLTWRDRTSGLTVVWIMDGLTVVSSRMLGGDQDWRLAPTGEQFDANRDGVADVVWRHERSGTTVLWTIVDGLATSTMVLDGGAGWSLVAAGDFDGNGFGDTVWRKDATGKTRIQLMQHGQVTGTLVIGGDTDWRVAAAYDATGDGTTDLFWRGVAGTTILDEYARGSVRSRSVKGSSLTPRLFAAYDVS